MSPKQPSPNAAQALLSVLRERLGSEHVLTAPEKLASFRGFAWLPARPQVALRYPLGQPSGVVCARSVDDVALVLREASTARVPVVPYGGGTGVMGGAQPVAGGIVLDVGSMRRIRAIEPANHLARVEAGVLLGDLAREADANGLLFAHDPWSQPIATVGGAVGTNGVGYLAAGYGSMGNQVRGLEVVLPTGEVVSWPGAAKTSTGPELWRLFIGSEGTLGVITAVVVQLFPRPEARVLSAFRFPRFAEGFRAIAEFDAVGLRPAMIDYEEDEGPPLATPARMHLAFDGPREVANAAARRASRICRAHGGVNVGRAAAERFWECRHSSAEWFLRRTAAPAPPVANTPPRVGSRYVDVAVPASGALDYCHQVVTIAHSFGVDVHSFGIWARPELVSFILEGPTGDVVPGPLEEATDTVLRLARAQGGSIEYCHGVGVRLAHLLPDELGSSYDLLRRLKAMLDPAGILNPGKLGL